MSRKRKPMPMPKSIRVGGRNVTLEISPACHLNDNTMGLHSTWFSRISLDADLSDEQKKATAVHELVHDIDAMAGVGMAERDVVAFSSVLFAAIRDNPDFLAWLKDESA